LGDVEGVGVAHQDGVGAALQLALLALQHSTAQHSTAQHSTAQHVSKGFSGSSLYTAQRLPSSLCSTQHSKLKKRTLSRNSPYTAWPSVPCAAAHAF
jgi:hypothetical protein